MEAQKKITKFMVIMLCCLVQFSVSLAERQRIVKGAIVLPGPVEDQKYPVDIVLKDQGIEFRCKKRIFQRINEFETPLKRRLFIAVDAIDDIEMDNRNTRIWISANDSFFRQYRNLFHIICSLSGFISMGYETFKFKILVEIASPSVKDIAYFNAINTQARKRREKLLLNSFVIGKPDDLIRDRGGHSE